MFESVRAALDNYFCGIAILGCFLGTCDDDTMIGIDNPRASEQDAHLEMLNSDTPVEELRCVCLSSPFTTGAMLVRMKSGETVVFPINALNGHVGDALELRDVEIVS